MVRVSVYVKTKQLTQSKPFWGAGALYREGKSTRARPVTRKLPVTVGLGPEAATLTDVTVPAEGPSGAPALPARHEMPQAS